MSLKEGNVPKMGHKEILSLCKHCSAFAQNTPETSNRETSGVSVM